MVMNLYKKITLLSYAACGLLSAADPAYTSPVGYVTQTLSKGYNLVGLTVHSPKIASGKFETIASTSLTDIDVTYASVTGKTYVLEITSGTIAGSIFEIPAANISGSVISVVTVPASDLVALGITSSDTYNLRLAPSLVDVFSLNTLANGGVLAGALNVANSDIVWIPTGAGTYTKYFLRSSGGYQRVTGTSSYVAVDGASVPIIYADGIQIQKKTTAAAKLTVSGEVKTKGTNSILGQGYNLISSVAPAGLTLRTANFITSPPTLASALNVANSDVIWIQKPDLSYDKYYYHSSKVWRNAVTNVNLPALTDPPISGAFYIQKRFSTVLAPLKLAVPASYSQL
jgi:hypothetical protein